MKGGVKEKYLKNIILIVVIFFIFVTTANAESIEEKMYVKTITQYDATGNVIGTFNIEMSEDEIYQDIEQESVSLASNVSNQYCTTTEGTLPCRETEYKIIIMRYTKSSSTYNVELALEWIKEPLITKYDVIAIRWTGNGTLTNAYGTQNALNKSETYYSYNGNNMKIASRGLGITMNMYDNTSDHIMRLYATFSGNPGMIIGTYQHARHSNITFDMSKSYTFNENGLGGVLLFSNDTITNYYDGMLGISDVTPYEI